MRRFVLSAPMKIWGLRGGKGPSAAKSSGWAPCSEEIAVINREFLIHSVPLSLSALGIFGISRVCVCNGGLSMLREMIARYAHSLFLRS